MISVGITGQSGFVGTHLFNYLSQNSNKFKCIPFEDAYFNDVNLLRSFVSQCDVIVHLAAMMRSPNIGEVYETNMRLVNQLIEAMEYEKVTPSIIFSSSIQEGNGSEYGRCKQEGRLLLKKWAEEHNAGFAGVLFPNLFGPGARPNAHSFIATFCYKLTHNEEPQVLVDNIVPLKYIRGLIDDVVAVFSKILKGEIIENFEIVPDYNIKVSDVLNILKEFKLTYIDNKCVPELDSIQKKDLFETFISYFECK